MRKIIHSSLYCSIVGAFAYLLCENCTLGHAMRKIIPSHSLHAYCIIAICVTNMLIATLDRVLVDEDHHFAGIHIATDWTRLPTRVASYVGHDHLRFSLHHHLRFSLLRLEVQHQELLGSCWPLNFTIFEKIELGISDSMWLIFLTLFS